MRNFKKKFRIEVNVIHNICSGCNTNICSADIIGRAYRVDLVLLADIEYNERTIGELSISPTFYIYHLWSRTIISSKYFNDIRVATDSEFFNVYMEDLFYIFMYETKLSIDPSKYKFPQTIVVNDPFINFY